MVAHPQMSYRTDLRRMDRRISTLLSWERMLAYLSVCGRAPFSAEQYDLFRHAVLATRQTGGTSMPHYKAVRTQVKNIIASVCFPTSSIEYMHSVPSPRGVQHVKKIMTSSKTEKPARSCITLVPPSE